MANDRNKKASAGAHNTGDDLDSLGVTQLLDELRDVPPVGAADDSFSLEDILAEFGTKTEPVYREVSAEDTAVPTEENPEPKKPEPAAKAEEKGTQEGEKKPRLVTNIVRSWEGGHFGDLDLNAPPDPTPWKKKGGEEGTNIHDTKPRVKVPHVSTDTIRHIPGAINGEEYDASGATRGFRIKKKEPQVDREMPIDYIKREEKRVRGQKRRAVLLFLLCLPVCYMVIAAQLGWPMLPFAAYDAHPFRFVLALAAAQLVALVLAYDIVAQGIRGLVCARPNIEGVVVFSNLMCLAHAAMSLVNHGVNVQMPYCAVSCVSLFFAVHGTHLKRRAWLRACKTAGATKEPAGVFTKDFYGDLNVFRHSIEDRETFVGHLTAQDGAEKFWGYFSVIVIVASVAFASVGAFAGGNGQNFVWALAAVSSLASPFFATMCYAQPFSIVTKKLSDVGAAIAGWYAVQELSGDLQVILRDTDVFPHGCVKLHGIKMFGEHSLEKTLAYATSIIKESRSGLYKVFAELLKSQYGRTEKVSALRYHESGGVEGVINGDRVLLGTASFMQRSGISMLERANVRNAVYIAINSELAGVFNVAYKVNGEVQNGFDAMKRRKIRLVLATIDFNLTPMMVEAHFGLSKGKRLKKKKKRGKGDGFTADGLDLAEYTALDSELIYPEVEERIDLSSDEQTIDRDPCAVVSRDGFAPMASSIIGARKLRSAAVKNTVLSAVCTIIGMLLMFYIVFCASAAAASPYNVLMYMALWTLVSFITSLRTGDF